MGLTKEFIEKQKTVLIKKREELRKEINRLESEDPFVEETKEVGGRDEDSIEDEVQESVGHDEVSENVSMLKAGLEQVERALGMIEKGTYGKDEISGQPINKNRLEAYPEATTAV